MGNGKNAGKWMGAISIHIATECKAGIPKAKRGGFYHSCGSSAGTASSRLMSVKVDMHFSHLVGTGNISSVIGNRLHLHPCHFCPAPFMTTIAFVSFADFFVLCLPATGVQLCLSQR